MKGGRIGATRSEHRKLRGCSWSRDAGKEASCSGGSGSRTLAEVRVELGAIGWTVACVVFGEVHLFTNDETKAGSTPFGDDGAIHRDAEVVRGGNGAEVLGHGFEAFNSEGLDLDTLGIGESVGTNSIGVSLFIWNIRLPVLVPVPRRGGIIAFGGGGIRRTGERPKPCQ